MLHVAEDLFDQRGVMEQLRANRNVHLGGPAATSLIKCDDLKGRDTERFLWRGEDRGHVVEATTLHETGRVGHSAARPEGAQTSPWSFSARNFASCAYASPEKPTYVLPLFSAVSSVIVMPSFVNGSPSLSPGL